MNKIKLIGITSVIALTLTGCATKGNWVPAKNSLTDRDKEIKFKKDDGYCDAVSYGSIPMPQPVYVESNSGTFTAYTNTGETYRGTYNSGGSFSAGFARGQAIGSAIAAKKARINVWKSCMYNLGWIQEEDLK